MKDLTDSIAYISSSQPNLLHQSYFFKHIGTNKGDVVVEASPIEGNKIAHPNHLHLLYIWICHLTSFSIN